MPRQAAKMFGTKKIPQAKTANGAGYPAWERPIHEKFLQLLLSNSFGNVARFGRGSDEMLNLTEELHGDMLTADKEFVAKALPYARNQGYMRTQPIYGLARLEGVDRKLFETTFPKVIRTPNDLRDFTVIMNGIRGGKSLSRPLKRAAGRWLADRMTQYWAIKYGGSGQNSLRAMIQAYHPKTGQPSPLFDYLMATKDGRFVRRDKIGEENGKPIFKNVYREVDLTDLPQIQAFEQLKKAETDDAKLTLIKAGKLPAEQSTAFAGDSKSVWVEIVKQMPIMALLKNLATIERHGIMNEVRDYVVQQLCNSEHVQKSKILPFRFADAYQHVQDTEVRQAIEHALDFAFMNLPEIHGQTAIALDISGSMATYLESAAIFAISAVKQTKGNSVFMLFNTRAKNYSVDLNKSTLTQAAKIRTSGGTDTSSPLDVLLRSKKKVDNFLILTDENQNSGAAFFRVLEQYRVQVNPKLRCYVMNVADSVSSPVAQVESGPLNRYLFGWSDRCLSYIGLDTQGWGSFVDLVNQGGKIETKDQDE